MEDTTKVFLDACLAIYDGQSAQGIDSSSPTFDSALGEPDAEDYFDEETENQTGDEFASEFVADLFRAADDQQAEAQPLTSIKNQLESNGNNLDTEYPLADILPKLTEYLVARWDKDRASLETEAADLQGLPDPHAGTQPPPTGQPAPTGTQPGTGNPTQPPLVGALPGAATQGPQPIPPGGTAQPGGTQGGPGQPAATGTAPPRTPLIAQRPERPPVKELRSHPRWQYHWRMALVSHRQNKPAKISWRARGLLRGDTEPHMDPWIRIQLTEDLYTLANGNLAEDPESFLQTPPQP